MSLELMEAAVTILQSCDAEYCKTQEEISAVRKEFARLLESDASDQEKRQATELLINTMAAAICKTLRALPSELWRKRSLSQLSGLIDEGKEMGMDMEEFVSEKQAIQYNYYLRSTEKILRALNDGDYCGPHDPTVTDEKLEEYRRDSYDIWQSVLNEAKAADVDVSKVQATLDRCSSNLERK